MADTASKLILDHNKGREPERLKIKLEKMADDLFSFFRGSCHLFHNRLAALGGNIVTNPPLAWCSGDLHVENFGTFEGDNGLAYFDVNDFDEAALAPASWEILRLATSILVALQSKGIAPDKGQKLALRAVRKYLDELGNDQARWLERDTATGPIGDLLKKLRDGGPSEKLEKNTEVVDGKRRIKLRKKRSLPASAQDRALVEALIAQYTAQLVARYGDRAAPERYKVLDVARRIAGTGSLGLRRWIIVTQGGSGSPPSNWLLDLKESVTSSLAQYAKAKNPGWDSEARRIVAVQRHYQAAPPAFLEALATPADGKSYVLRELQPSEDRLDLDELAKSPDGLHDSVADMGRLAAWAQLRASGRRGAAVADDLVAFTDRQGLKEDILTAATAMAGQAQADWVDYCKAYKAGAFAPILG